MNHLTFNQITLLTDGLSNNGISPIEAARKALEQNIIINVIGIMSKENIEDNGMAEVEAIAGAGGGLFQIITAEQIAKTVQMVTKQAINRTLQQVVHSELTEILGSKDITMLSPEKRLKVTKVINDMAEHGDLNVLLLIDQSASMLSKMGKVKEAILDFQLSLHARAGESNFAVATFPGKYDYIDIKIPWTNEIKNLDSLLYNLNPTGNTPTGPAIKVSTQYFIGQLNLRRKYGVLDEYIV